ncbi:MAG: hypothetical protein ACTSWN_17450 [Promethearchaeota archaeon]
MSFAHNNDEAIEKVVNEKLDDAADAESEHDWGKAIRLYEQARLIIDYNNLTWLRDIVNKKLVETKKACQEFIEGQYDTVSDLLKSLEHEKALVLLKKTIGLAEKVGFKKLGMKGRKMLENVSAIEQIMRMAKISKKIKIDDFCGLLNKSRHDLLNLCIEWSQKFGFKIDGEYIVITEDDASDLQLALADLDREFDEWTEND